ncbi:zf-HC2 domain-containing protein [Streptomyces phaeochromogenes]|uniref:zf-HC2 domain-containing protein n=1 Tax=Streptomyces phaeochromogenes TaxID=1923 RepID=UPI0039A1D5D2
MPSPVAGCDEIREWIGAHLIGALEPEEDAMVTAHLARCSGCRSESDDLAGVVRLLRDALPLLAARHGAPPPCPQDRAQEDAREGAGGGRSGPSAERRPRRRT